eukprot:SAG31_NODE_989_length_10527_cov_14.905639_8_plen_183_part_00
MAVFHAGRGSDVLAAGRGDWWRRGGVSVDGGVASRNGTAAESEGRRRRFQHFQLTSRRFRCCCMLHTATQSSGLNRGRYQSSLAFARCFCTLVEAIHHECRRLDVFELEWIVFDEFTSLRMGTSQSIVSRFGVCIVGHLLAASNHHSRSPPSLLYYCFLFQAWSIDHLCMQSCRHVPFTSSR